MMLEKNSNHNARSYLLVSYFRVKLRRGFDSEIALEKNDNQSFPKSLVPWVFDHAVDVLFECEGW